MKTQWTKARDAHLREHYNPRLKVDPAQLALRLGLAEKTIIIRLSQLGLRSRRAERNVQSRYIAGRLT
jgi:hypothetical protein